MDKDQVVEYYCTECEKSVKCGLLAWIGAVPQQTPPQVRVEVSAKCPYCSRVLGRGDVIVELS